MSKSEKPSIAAIPRRLELEGRPELQEFPLNILFSAFAFKAVPVLASAIYEPDLQSFQTAHRVQSLVYYNKYDTNWSVKISKGAFGWRGRKFAGNRQVFFFEGKEWREFFATMTSTGLSEGEAYVSEPIANFLPANRRDD
ncbi:MAG TPA: hypothetical protein VLH19_05285 [Patescibacteria group bacterium]|nr:hypothetical protein [Patescibacteria group bacterium]